MKYGADGYALYWLCLELIAAPIDKHNLTFELEHDAEILAYRLKIDSALVEEIMRYFVILQLFEVSANAQRISCLKLAHRIENSIVKNKELQEIQKLIKHNDSVKSRTIPDNSGKLRLDIDTDTDTDKKQPCASDKFYLFWNEYPKKKDKAKTIIAWKKHKLENKAEQIITDVVNRKANDYDWVKESGKYIPYPTTYLNGKRWEDEATQLPQNEPARPRKALTK